MYTYQALNVLLNLARSNHREHGGPPETLFALKQVEELQACFYNPESLAEGDELDEEVTLSQFLTELRQYWLDRGFAPPAGEVLNVHSLFTQLHRIQKSKGTKSPAAVLTCNQLGFLRDLLEKAIVLGLDVEAARTPGQMGTAALKLLEDLLLLQENSKEHHLKHLEFLALKAATENLVTFYGNPEEEQTFAQVVENIVSDRRNAWNLVAELRSELERYQSQTEPAATSGTVNMEPITFEVEGVTLTVDNLARLYLHYRDAYLRAHTQAVLFGADKW